MLKHDAHLTSLEFEGYFVSVLEEAAGELLARVDPYISRVPSRGDDPAVELAGVVGFVGPAVRGLISVAIARSPSDARRDLLSEDRASELANQLAGRVKNQLSRLGVTYEVAPPVTLCGRQLLISSRERETKLVFRGPLGTYDVIAALEVPGPVDLRRVGANDEPMAEGDVLLF